MSIEQMLENAPEEIRTMAAKHNESVKRLMRAEKQCKLWNDEFSLSKQSYDSTEADWKAILLRYENEQLRPDEKQSL